MSSTKRVLLFIAALTAVRLWVTAHLELQSIETYYWLYGRNPALGYYDHPAMIGWIVWLSTALFGDGPVGVRLLTLLGGGLSVWLIFLAARRLYDEETGVWAALLVGAVPLTFAYGALATPDAPLLLFWAATVWALSHALSGGRKAWWYLAGVFLGLTMLSKYTGVFLALGTLLFLAACPDQRAWLRRPEPYLAALVALLVFSPTLIWNAAEGWKSLTYQGLERFESGRGGLLRQTVRFVRSQLGLVTPVPLIWACVAGFRWKGLGWQGRLMIALGMPLLLFFLCLVPFRSVRGHWPAPAYVTLLLLAAAAVARGGKWGRWLHAGTAAVLAAAYLVLSVGVAVIPRDWKHGWEELAGRVGPLAPDFILARDYHDASQLAYHLRPLPASDFTPVGRPAKAFPWWWRADDFAGRDAVVVWAASDWPEGRELVAARFRELAAPLEVEVTRWAGRREKFVLVRALGYSPR